MEERFTKDPLHCLSEQKPKKVSPSPTRGELLVTGVNVSKFQFAPLYYTKPVIIWVLARGCFLFIGIEKIFQGTAVTQTEGSLCARS